MPAVRRLPPPAKLRDLYVRQGRSAESLAQEFGVHHRAVVQRLRSDARRHGWAWPAKPQTGSQPWVLGMRRGRDDVRALLVAAEIRELGMSQKELSRRSGVSQSIISRILSGKQEWIYRPTAERIMAAIVKIETSAKISAARKRSAA